MTPHEPGCHVCGSGEVISFPQFSDFHRVTSDCRPFRQGGTLRACRGCGTVQKAVDERWQAECREIYEAYAIYSQAGGLEQKVFDAATGTGLSRSERLLQKVLALQEWPERGRLLDVGCGNGSLLRSASRLRPGWRLCGTELNDRHRAAIESIPGAEKLQVGAPEEVPGRFDLISAVHLLEHIPGPRGFLEKLHPKLEEKGVLFLQSPDLAGNAMDLLIADHCTHFTRESLGTLLQRSGYEARQVTSDWVAKELSAVASRRASRPIPAPADPGPLVARSLEWLRSLRDLARRTAGAETVGIFGSSIGATWIFAELDGRPAFFVDEDPDRVGRSHLGRPILAPAEIPSGADLLVALAPGVANQVRARLEPRGRGVRWHVPPASSAS